MRIAIIKSIGLAVALSACLASVMFGQTKTTMALEPSSFGQNGANGESTPFYTGTIDTYATVQQTINGAPSATPISSITNVLTFCDDLTDEVYWGQQFAVLTTDLSEFTGVSPNVSSVYYGTTPNTPAGAALQTQDYVAVAILAAGLASDPTNVTKQDIDGFAIWDIFQPAATLAQLGGITGPDASAVETAAANALTAAAGLTGAQEEAKSGYDVTIYTPTYDGTTPYNTANNPAPVGSPGTEPQEIITLTYVPEPSTWAVLGFDLVGAGILGLYFRRRQPRGRS
jgi:hypothetical protein